MIQNCRSCGSTQTESFFEMGSIPMSSCILTETRQAAAEFGRGDLELAVCHQCGFIQNQLFQPELVDYTMPYEESQAFSPRFVAFQNEVITRLIADYELEGKTIFEVGSGKGAFLDMICRAAQARGIGIDPAAEPGRLGDDVDITLIREFFDETKTDLTGDLIVCRHTLEHVQPVGKFVGDIVESARKTPGSVTFFELPDTERILAEGAFWDVYYEHCSYFTTSSLSYLFRSRGFDILQLQFAFDDQYLLLEAAVGEVDRSIDSDHVADIVARCRTFGEGARREVDHWRSLVDEFASRGETVVVWGAGSKAVGFLSALGRDAEVAAAVDVNPFKQGSFLPGSAHEIISPESLRELQPELVLVMNPIYTTEIGNSLADLGLHPRLEALGVPAT